MKYPERYRNKTGMFASNEGDGGLFIINVKFDAEKPPIPRNIIVPDHLRMQPQTEERKVSFAVFATNDAGWEHISVTIPKEKRTPTWDEMEFLKQLFWEPQEAAFQIHPPQSEYVNMHPYCLHIWRKIGFEYPLPPTELIGFVKPETTTNNSEKY